MSPLATHECPQKMWFGRPDGTYIYECFVSLYRRGCVVCMNIYVYNDVQCTTVYNVQRCKMYNIHAWWCIVVCIKFM